MSWKQSTILTVSRSVLSDRRTTRRLKETKHHLQIRQSLAGQIDRDVEAAQWCLDSLQRSVPGQHMSTSDPLPSPSDHSAAGKDQGAETASRYRFQHTWAAIMCCALLDNTEDVETVYCEHHDDVLIRHTDGTFSAHQVKSRAATQTPWRPSHQQVLVAFTRFARLERDYPGHFRSFRFLTNHPLYVANTATSLGYILRHVADASTPDDLPTPIRKWLRKLSHASNTSEAVAFQALRKTTASCDLPKLRDATSRLMDTLADCWDEASDCSRDKLRRAALQLVDECTRASALGLEQELPTYLLATHDPESEAAVRLDGKRMTLERVTTVLREALTCTAILTGSSDSAPIPGQGSATLLQQKLDAGGFSPVSYNSARDLRDKADYLGISYIRRIGRNRGLPRYQHICSLVLSDAARALEAVRTANSTFGPEMREALRRRFRERRADGEPLYDYSDEHLEGVAYSLTARCTVHWSNERPWEAT